MDAPGDRTTADVRPPSVIVMLEDDQNDMFFVHRAFEKAHIANPLRAFATAEHARHYLEQTRLVPAMFILDVTLAGGQTGLAFLRWVREQPRPLGATPALMLTGSTSPTDRDEAALLGAIGFLNKPVTNASLLAAVESLGMSMTSLPGRAIECAIERV